MTLRYILMDPKVFERKPDEARGEGATEMLFAVLEKLIEHNEALLKIKRLPSLAKADIEYEASMDDVLHE